MLKSYSGKAVVGWILLIGLCASVYFAFIPKASAVEPFVKSDCPSGKICLWSGTTFGGQQSFWNASELGCHALENINPGSVFNNTTNRKARFPGLGTIVAGSSFSFSPAWEGEMCIEVQ